MIYTNENECTALESVDTFDTTEYAQYSMEIERTFAEVQKGLALCYDPKGVALNVLRVATEFYDADWCGIFDVDLELDYSLHSGGITAKAEPWRRLWCKNLKSWNISGG